MEVSSLLIVQPAAKIQSPEPLVDEHSVIALAAASWQRLDVAVPDDADGSVMTGARRHGCASTTVLD